MHNDKRLLTVAEAARLLGVSRSHLYPIVMSKQLPSVEIGRCRRIRVQDLDAYIQRLAEEGE